jgi:hypothetical protein
MGIRFALFAEQNGKKFLFRLLHLMPPMKSLNQEVTTGQEYYGEFLPHDKMVQFGRVRHVII